jgi:hypothetical protein
MLNQATRPRGQAFWPIMGFFLIVSVGTISYFVTPLVVNFLGASLPNFPPQGIKPDSWNLVVGGTLFMVLIMLASVIVAAAAPKRKTNVAEKTLIHERQEMLNYRKAAKMRQNKLNRQQEQINAGRS